MHQLPAQTPNTRPESFFDSYEARRESARTLLGFSLVYLTGYFTDPPAAFHAELIHSLEDEAIKRLLIIGFRGSSKSTLGSLALPLWAALEHPDKFPFIILVADSNRQATLNIFAIKHELERTISSSRTSARSRARSLKTFLKAKERNGRSKTSSSRTACASLPVHAARRFADFDISSTGRSSSS
jgi:hypothetical protein